MNSGNQSSAKIRQLSQRERREELIFPDSVHTAACFSTTISLSTDNLSSRTLVLPLEDRENALQIAHEILFNAPAYATSTCLYTEIGEPTHIFMSPLQVLIWE